MASGHVSSRRSRAPFVIDADHGSAVGVHPGGEGFLHRFVAIAAVGFLVTPGLGVAKRPKPDPCPPARYVVVEGAPLVGGGATTGADAIAVAPGEVTIGGSCTAAAAIKPAKAATRVRARWDSCATLTKLKLKAKIAAPECAQMQGTLKAKKTKPHPFRAVLSTCGDGYFDPSGETCDAGEGCGAGEQCTAACTCEIATAAGIVTLPSGVGLALTDLSVMSGAGMAPVGADGSFTVAALTHLSTQVELVTGDGKIVMLGFVDPRPGAPSGQISTTSTAQVLLYYALGAFLLPPEHYETVLALIAERPEVAALGTAIAARVAANPTAVHDGDAELIDALMAAREAILAPVLPVAASTTGARMTPPTPLAQAAETSTNATLVLIDPNADVIQSGVQILQNLTGTGIVAQNTFRRPAAFLLYQVAWKALDGTQHEIDPPQQVGGANEIPSTRQLSLLNALTDGLTGAAPFAPILSAPVDLPLVPGSQSTLYEVVVLGPTLDVVSVPPLFLDPRFFPFRDAWDAEIDRLAFRSLWADFVGPTMSALFLGAAANISGTKLRALEQDFADGFGPALREFGIVQPLVQRLDAVFFLVNLVSGASEFTKMANLVNGILVDDAINTGKYEAIRGRLSILSKSTGILAAVDAALAAFDIGAVIKDLQKSSKAVDWRANAIQAPVRLTPATATVTKSEPAVTLTATVNGFPDSTFLYRYTTTGAHGTVCPIIGDCAAAVDSTFDNVQYVADPGSIVDGDLDTVTVEVFEDPGSGTIPPGAEPIGSATSQIKGEVPCPDPEAVVDVPSNALRSILRQRLAIPAGEDLTCADMERLTTLSMSANINTLEGLQFATNLTSLSCHFCLLDEVPQLSRLRKLTSLSLTQNGISDLTPLSGLTALTSLDLYWNNIADVTPLAGLTNLTSLNLWDNEITSVSALAGLTQLEDLNLRENQITSVSALAGLVRMRTLTLSFNGLTTLAGLESMTALEELAVDYNALTDIGALADLAALVSLDAGVNEIEDVAPLNGKFALLSLNLRTNQVADLATVDWAGMPLEQLDLSSNRLTSIEPVEDLFAVFSLDVSYNRITDATPVESLSELYQLSMRNNLIADLQPLVDNTGLATGDVVNIQENCLSENDPDIQTLLGRGVSVYYEPQGCAP